MRKPLWAVFSLLIITGFCLGEDPALTFHNNTQRTGRTTYLGPLPPRLRWTIRTGASIEASPVMGRNGAIYLASTDGRLYALSARGGVKWIFEAKESIFATPAIAPDGSIHFSDLDGWYYAVRPDGSLKWSTSLASGHLECRAVSSPVIAPDGQSYIGAWNDHFFSFGPDGKLLWEVSFQGEGQITAAPALDISGNVYLATHDPSDKNKLAVLKFQPASSNVVWKFAENMGVDRNRIISSPLIDTARGQLYVGIARENDGVLYAIDLTAGTLVYRAVLPKGIVSSPALGWDGTVYVGCLNGKLYALDPANGREQWNFTADGYYVMGSPVVDGSGIIFVGDSDGILYALSPAGKELWRFRCESNIASAPIISEDETLYVTSFDSKLYALGYWKPRTPRGSRQ